MINRLDKEKLRKAQKLEVFRLLRGALRDSRDPANTIRALWLMLGPEGFCMAWLAEGGPRCDRLVIDTLLGTQGYHDGKPLCEVKQMVAYVIEAVRFIHGNEEDHLDMIADRLASRFTTQMCARIMHVEGITRTSNMVELARLTEIRITKDRTSAEIVEYHADAMEAEQSRIIAELSGYVNPPLGAFAEVMDLGMEFPRPPED